MIKYCFLLLTTNSLFALTTLNVTSSLDNNPGGFGEPGDLRYALNTMNQSLNAGPSDNYEIVFSSPMTIALSGILPIINNSSNAVNITIGNSDSIPTVTINGGNSYSGFFIPTGNVTIQNMTFQNLTAQGGYGGDGISGGGGGMGAGGAIYAPETFLNGSLPSITLMNVSINNCSAVGGDGGSYFRISSPTGQEGGGGGGGFSGNGGSITTTGSTGGAGGGGFGGDGGNVTLSINDVLGGGGGGGGIGSRASTGTNLGNGGSDQFPGANGNGYGLSSPAGSGGGAMLGGINAGGGGGGGAITEYVAFGGGGGGSSGGINGTQPLGSTPPGGTPTPSGGNGADGGGGGGGGVVSDATKNAIDGQAGSGGYGGGGGGGAGTGAYDTNYTVTGGSGGVGGGGGGGGVDQSGSTSAQGGDSVGGGGGGGGGPSNSGSGAVGGTDTGYLGGGSGGSGANNIGPSYGGGGGGGGSGLGGAVFVDTGLNFTIQALPGIPTTFNTSNNSVVAGTGGSGGLAGGTDGSALGNNIFLRSGSSLTFQANAPEDILTLGDGVSFIDDTSFGGVGTSVFVSGNGTVIYNGIADYQGYIIINNANFKVNGQINQAHISVCRNIGLSSQRGTLSGIGTLSGDVFVNSGTISPDTGGTLTLGSLILNPADPLYSTLGSLVHIEIDSSGTSLVAVTAAATLAGILEIELDPTTTPGTYIVLTSSGITGTFDSVEFTSAPPTYSLSYLPIGSPTFVQFNFFGFAPSYPSLSTQGLSGNNAKVASYLNTIAPEAESLGLTEQFTLLNDLSSSEYQKALESISPSRNSSSTFAGQNVMFMLSESLGSHFTKQRLASNQGKNNYIKETAFLASNEYVADNPSPHSILYAPKKNTSSQIWTMGFGQFSSQNSQNQTPSITFNSGGFIAAYDYGSSEQGCIGALTGYAYSSVQQAHSSGSSQLNAGYLSLYGMRSFSDFYIDASVWGEYAGIDQKRIICFPGFSGTVKSSYNAEQIDLHLGMGYDFNINTATIEPFGLVDWVYEWDPSYKEEGSTPYNMKFSSRTSWMLRAETGLNGYKTNTYSWGIFIAEAKLSYVYKKPHDIGKVHAAIVNAPASFIVEAFTAEQNLISPALELFWQTNWNGYGSISYNGEFGSGYSSNQFYGKIGYSF